MNKLDIDIVSHLQKNGRATIAELVRSMGDAPVSEETVRRRLNKLKQEEILRVVAVPNAEKMSYGVQVIIGLNVRPGMTDDVADALCELDESHWVSVTAGSFNIILWATLTSVDHLCNFLSASVGKIPGVSSVQTFVNLESRKQVHGIDMKMVTE